MRHLTIDNWNRECQILQRQFESLPSNNDTSVNSSAESLPPADPDYRQTSRYGVQNARRFTDKTSNTQALEVCDLSSRIAAEPLQGNVISVLFSPDRVSSSPLSSTNQTNTSALYHSCYCEAHKLPGQTLGGLYAVNQQEYLHCCGETRMDKSFSTQFQPIRSPSDIFLQKDER